MSMGPTQPASPDKGFPNPHSPDFPGERTPAEQAEFERQEAIRAAERGETTAPADEAPAGLPSNQATDEDRTANRQPGY